MNKTLVLTIAGLSAAGLLVYGVSTAHAQTTTTPGKTIIQRLAEKFDLQEADVKAVFDEDHASRQADMQAKFEERLTQLVTDGKLTDSQKQAILTKHKELQDKRQSMKEGMKDKTPEERKTIMEQEKTDLETWAKSQGIDLSVIPMFGMHGGKHGGMRGGFVK